MFTKIKKSLEKFIVAVVMMVLNLVGKPLDLKKWFNWVSCEIV